MRAVEGDGEERRRGQKHYRESSLGLIQGTTAHRYEMD